MTDSRWAAENASASEFDQVAAAAHAVVQSPGRVSPEASWRRTRSGQEVRKATSAWPAAKGETPSVSSRGPGRTPASRAVAGGGGTGGAVGAAGARGGSAGRGPR